MAAVLEPKDAAAKHDSQVDEQIAQATSRIRTHDLAFGGLTLAALALGYATLAILLDKYLNLAAWVRQVGLIGFAGVFAAAAYLTLLRPLRKRINPLYAARQVESTLDDPKNSVTGYVDAREKGDLNATVKAALASRAAKAAAEADVNRAVDHRSLIWLGGVAVALVLALIVLFFVFRPSQFASLAGRAFMPFSSGAIVTQTQLDIVKPQPADATITTGQSITVAVYVSGKVPKADGPDKVRLLVRHNPNDPNYDEVAMVQGNSSRDWEVRVPDHIVNNGNSGFWYKVAGGDATTAEHKVTVQTLPRFQTFQVSYDYPKYLRMPPFSNDNPVIQGPRGTTVTLLAKTNRAVRDGLMETEPPTERVTGVPDASDPNTLKYVFKLSETGKYKLTFNAASGERTASPFAGIITVEQDRAPIVTIAKPEEDETQQPSNGQLAVDGKIGDDWGIDTVTLKMRTLGAAGRQLPDVPFLNGKSPSFRREKDNSYPTDLDYKGSVDFAKITKDAAGLDVALTPGTVVEYWLEAADNCTEPKPNVGSSARKKVTLGEPRVEEKQKKDLDKDKDQRKDEEKKHTENQQKKLEQENRDRNKGQQQQPDKGNQGDKPDAKKGGPGDAAPKKDGPQENQPNDAPKDQPPPKEGEPKGDAAPKKDGMTGGEPKQKDGERGQPKGDAKGANKDENKGGKDDIEKTARELQQELQRDRENGAGIKPNDAQPDQERPEPAQAKPQPKDGMNGANGATDAKPDPKNNDPANPMGKPDAAPSSAKPQPPTDPKKPDDQGGTDAKPNPQTKPMGGKPDAQPSEKRPQPAGGMPEADKPQPKESKDPPPKEPNGKSDPNPGGAPKPTEPKKDPNPGAAGPNDKKDEQPPAGAAKPQPPQPKAGEDKPTDPKTQPADPKGGTPEAGGPKPDKAPPAAGTKPQPKAGPQEKDADAKPDGGANTPMKPNETPAADTKPAADAGKKDDKKGEAGAKPPPAGEDKPPPTDRTGDKNAGASNTAPPPKEKLTEQEKKELQDAAKDLAGNDEKKKDEARQKLDKAIGKDKREELEQLNKDLQSKDENTRKAAEQKVKDAIEQAKKQSGEPGGPKNDEPKGPTDGKKGGPKEAKNGTGDKKEGPKEPTSGAGDKKDLTEQQKKEIEDAVKDLQGNDEKKKDEARKKLDKMVGEQNRKDAEELMNDLKSDDMKKRDAAKQQLDELKKQMEKRAQQNQDDKKDGPGGMPEPKPGKEPTPEELADLAKKAQDLQSPDDQKRKQAQKELDEKIGEEQRKKLEEMMKNQKPGDSKEDAEKLKKRLEEMAKGQDKNPNRSAPKGGSPEAKGPMAVDESNAKKAAQLQLEEFKKEENRKRLQDKKGWSDAEYDKFIKDFEGYVEKLPDGKKDRPTAPAPTPKDGKGPQFTPGSASGVDNKGATVTEASAGGTVAPPPGFDDAKRKFQKALEKKP